MGFINTAANLSTARNTAQINRRLAPKPTPARAAEIRHETRWAYMWLWYGIVALPALAIAGTPALWFLAPVGVLLAVVHIAGARHEASLSPRDAARAQERRSIEAGVTMGPAGCTWCGSVATHRDERGNPQQPVSFHAAEITEAVEAAVAARFAG